MNYSVNEKTEKMIQAALLGAFAIGAVWASGPIKVNNLATTSNVIQQNASLNAPTQLSVGNSECSTDKSEQGILSQSQLNSLLKFKAGVSKETLINSIGLPFCSLPSSKISKAAPLERVVYFLPGSSNNVVIVSFQKDLYRGFFSTSIKDLDS